MNGPTHGSHANCALHKSELFPILGNWEGKQEETLMQWFKRNHPTSQIARRKQEILRRMSASEWADIGAKPGDIDHIERDMK